ncbi:hypothetical protein [Serratia sp. N21D137]|uniref:hypothetical protein n=1 Tax=Serratia sp. N21D137 TaxID=3397495 RepID=UPI0039DF8D05
MSKETGGPAFPIWHETSVCASGMSIRDYFAGLAMQGWLTSYGEDMAHPAQRGNADDVARNAYALADAMLKIRGEAHHEE